VKLAAFMMVRNEAAIIADSLGHLLHTVLVDRLYVADNGSTDATPAILRRIAAADPRLAVFDRAGPFRQPEVMNDLLRQAVDDGADWLIPADADEFLPLDGGALRAACAAAGAVSGFRLRMVNFAQLRAVQRDHPGAIASMIFRALPEGTPEQARRLVEAGLPFLRMAYPPKLVLRANRALVLQWGQHHADGLGIELAPAPLCDLLHAPIRARQDLESRAEAGRRFGEVLPDPEAGWHLKRIAAMDRRALDAEWRANSAGPGCLLGGGYRLDLRLRRIALRQRGFRERVVGKQALLF
jgi:glycosyltransferase involved in cell wall biosynthesis